METLASGRTLTGEDAGLIVETLYGVLKDEDPQLLWDAAFDSIDLLKPSHTPLVSHLYDAIKRDSLTKSRRQSFRLERWNRKTCAQGRAIYAIGKIGGSEAVACLTELKGKVDSELEREVKRALKKCG
ncbi:MAG TPA: hypothetical protein VGL56_12315 [Fimbriimonadaceae bacterium]